jgi:hypothetical protein
MQPLPGWQAKLAELEAACRKAEAMMLQAPTRPERSAALDLAGEQLGDPTIASLSVLCSCMQQLHGSGALAV